MLQDYREEFIFYRSQTGSTPADQNLWTDVFKVWQRMLCPIFPLKILCRVLSSFFGCPRNLVYFCLITLTSLTLLVGLADIKNWLNLILMNRFENLVYSRRGITSRSCACPTFVRSHCSSSLQTRYLWPANQMKYFQRWSDLLGLTNISSIDYSLMF